MGETGPYVHKGVSVDVIPGVLARLQMSVPEVAAIARAHLANQLERPRRVTYSGNDAAAELCLHLIEAIFCYEQLRVEVLDQARLHGDYCEALPESINYILSNLLKLEPKLFDAALEAAGAHASLWGRREPVGRRIEGAVASMDVSDEGAG